MKQDTKIKREFDELMSLFAGRDENILAQAERLCNEAAFLRIYLTTLRQSIIKEGPTQKYQNGSNQWGYKRSIAAEQYDKSISSYLRTMAQINKLLPKDEQHDLNSSEIMSFIRGEI